MRFEDTFLEKMCIIDFRNRTVFEQASAAILSTSALFIKKGGGGPGKNVSTLRVFFCCV